MSQIITEAEKPLTEKQAAQKLGFAHASGVKDLRNAKIIRPIPMKSWQGRWVNNYLPSALAEVKPCLETARRLMRDGKAEAFAGHLLVLKHTENAEEPFAVTDLADNLRGGAIYSVDQAAKKIDVAPTLLLSRIGATDGKASFGDLRIYGTSAHILFEWELNEFKKELKKDENVDRNTMLTVTELCKVVGVDGGKEADGEGLLKSVEVGECAAAWEAAGRLPAVMVWDKQPGAVRVAKKDERKETVKRYLRKRYNAERFKQLWTEDPTPHIEEAKRLARSPGIPVTDMREAMKKRGIVGQRLLRVIRLAGIVFRQRCKGSPTVYIVRHRGPTPVRKRKQEGATDAWLKDRLKKNGPSLRSAVLAAAKKGHFDEGTVKEAFKRLDGKSFIVIPAAANGKSIAGRHAFWYLPGQTPPTKEEALRIVAQHEDSTKPSRAAETPASAKSKRGRKRGWRDQAAIDRDREGKKWWLANGKPSGEKLAEQIKVDRSYAYKLIKKWRGK